MLALNDSTHDAIQTHGDGARSECFGRWLHYCSVGSDTKHDVVSGVHSFVTGCMLVNQDTGLTARVNLGPLHPLCDTNCGAWSRLYSLRNVTSELIPMLQVLNLLTTADLLRCIYAPRFGS